MEKRALIELDGHIDIGFCGQYEIWKEKYLPNSPMQSFFDIIITEAYDNKLAVWDAILESDEIWVDSSYIGDSGRLLVQMLDSADRFMLRDKTLINMNKYTDVSYWIPDDARVLMKRLELKGIKFIYADYDEYETYLP